MAWLSVCSEVQMICIWSSWCHCQPIISHFIKIEDGLTFLVPAYPDCLGKEAIKQMSVIFTVYVGVCAVTCVVHKLKLQYDLKMQLVPLQLLMHSYKCVW